jgi:hypothetical protein
MLRVDEASRSAGKATCTGEENAEHPGMNKMSRRLSNHYSDSRLVSLAKLKTAVEFPGRDRNGPYVVMQYGYDPDDPAMRTHDFLLGRSGGWLALHWFIRLPVPERRKEFLYSTVGEVLAQMEQMTGKVRVISNKPDNVDEDGEGDAELEQVLRA